MNVLILKTNEVKIAFPMVMFLFMKSLFFILIPFTQGQVGVTCHSLVSLHSEREVWTKTFGISWSVYIQMMINDQDYIMIIMTLFKWIHQH